MKQKRTAVLSRIRDIVLAPSFTPSSVTPIVNACAAALPAAELSNILTQLNIEGHTALYWTIVNNRPQAFLCLHLRIACMITSNHATFTQLNLGRQRPLIWILGSEQMRLRGLLGCPPDGIQVHTCDELTNQFCESGCSKNRIDYVPPPKMTWCISKELGDWVMHDTTEYVDHEGALHAKLEMTLL
ncbi:hypothetical protein F4604DRAFT_1727960 [Suillus subluteus]|nr:hypothetical protein F4604DRAFT_1727960 [Suillus subluteus]